MTGRKWVRDEPDPERRLAREAHAVGMLRTEYLMKRINAVHKEAIANGWHPDALAQAVDAIEQLANEVWGALGDRPPVIFITPKQ